MKYKIGNIIERAWKEAGETIEREKKIIPQAIRILQKGSEEAKWAAVKVLGEISNDETTEALLSALETELFLDIKIAIIEELSICLYEEKVLLAISAMKNDVNPLVRNKVREVLQRQIEFDRSYEKK